MIKVDRQGLPASLDLGDPASPASRELAQIVDFLGENGVLPAKMDFNAYSNHDVKEMLKDVFSRKCGYCETFASAGHDSDIEHYRPKKGVTEADEAGIAHPGYWWLAMRWDNLLLSCQHCNQYRKQVIIPHGATSEEIEAILRGGQLVTSGKKNRFPVENNGWIVDHTQDVANEAALLIDPCVTDPEDLLEWEFDDALSTVKARANDPRGEATIDILGLKRRDLTETRVTVLNALRKRRTRIRSRLRKIIDADTEVAASEALQIVLEDIEDLKASCGKDQTFAGMARAFCKQLEDEVTAALQ